MNFMYCRVHQKARKQTIEACECNEIEKQSLRIVCEVDASNQAQEAEVLSSESSRFFVQSAGQFFVNTMELNAISISRRVRTLRKSSPKAEIVFLLFRSPMTKATLRHYTRGTRQIEATCAICCNVADYSESFWASMWLHAE